MASLRCASAANERPPPRPVPRTTARLNPMKNSELSFTSDVPPRQPKAGIALAKRDQNSVSKPERSLDLAPRLDRLRSLKTYLSRFGLRVTGR